MTRSGRLRPLQQQLVPACLSLHSWARWPRGSSACELPGLLTATLRRAAQDRRTGHEHQRMRGEVAEPLLLKTCYFLLKYS